MSFPHEEIESDGTTLPSYLEPRSPRRALEMVLTEPAHAVPGQHWRATQLAVCNRTLRREGLQVWMDLMPEGDIYFGLMVQVHLVLAMPSCSCGARRRRPVALPAVDVMASFCMLSHGCYGPLEVSTQGMMDNFSHCGDPTGEGPDPRPYVAGPTNSEPRGRHPDDAGLMNPTYPKEPPILLSPPTPSKPSKPKQVNPELEKMCQEAFSDMVLLPRSAVDLNLKLKWRPSKEEVSKIILELTRDNVAALAAADPGLIVSVRASKNG
eukprot:s1673_g4.t1